MKRANGFTFIELTVVLAIVGIAGVLTLGVARQGFLQEYHFARSARSLVNALHLAKIRALGERKAIRVFSSQTVGTVDGYGWYPQVEFQYVADAPNPLVVGDYVTFSGLNEHSDMNGVPHYVSSVQAVDADANKYKFTCEYYSEGLRSEIFGTADQPAFTMPLSWSSRLVIRKEPTISGTDTTDNEYFIYTDKGFNVTSSDAENIGDDLVVKFDSRGLPVNQAGYQFRFEPAKPDKQLDLSKWVSVTPIGKVTMGNP
jgi:prepilin-type N-terminal cleavage/methylation domain-containing protein